jgi:hypothetical protein
VHYLSHFAEDKVSELPLEDAHFLLGIAILCLYVVQAFLGLGVLL